MGWSSNGLLYKHVRFVAHISKPLVNYTHLHTCIRNIDDRKWYSGMCMYIIPFSWLDEPPFVDYLPFIAPLLALAIFQPKGHGKEMYIMVVDPQNTTTSLHNHSWCFTIKNYGLNLSQPNIRYHMLMAIYGDHVFICCVMDKLSRLPRLPLEVQTSGVLPHEALG